MFIAKLTLAVSCVFSGVLLTTDALAADPIASIQSNRERVAKDYPRNSDQLTIARLSLQQSGQDVDVLVRLKGGDNVVVDRIEQTDLKSLNTIEDDSGQVVGLIRYWSEKLDPWVVARAAFATYFVGTQSLFKRSGEFRCHKVPSEGPPAVRLSNSRWNSLSLQLDTNVRASCHHVNFTGSSSYGRLQALNPYAKVGTAQHAITDEDRRLSIGFTSDGDVADIVPIAERPSKEALACISEAQKGDAFKVCDLSKGNSWKAFWPKKDGSGASELGGDCGSGAAHRREQHYLIVTCARTSAQDSTAAVDIEFATSEHPVAFNSPLTCGECKTLAVDRLAFDRAKRAISMNIDTDAKAIELKGVVLPVPSVAPVVKTGDSAVKLPILEIHFNERWQVAGMSILAQNEDDKQTASQVDPTKQ